MTGGCEGDPVEWLTTIHDFGNLPCVFTPVAGLPLRASDVNGDDEIEAFASDEIIPLVIDGVLTTGNDVALWYSELAQSPTGVVAKLRPVISSELVRNWAVSNELLHGFDYAKAYLMGWRDTDADGDLDLLIYLFGYTYDGSDENRLDKIIWIENTGFQHTTHLTGDINGDGKVNGADLGLVLSNWQE